MRCRHLREPDVARNGGHPAFVIGKAVGVHQHDGDGTQAGVEARLQALTHVGLIQRDEYVSVRRHALRHLLHPAVEQFGQHDVPVEQARAVLVADAQLVAEAARDEQRRGLAPALQQRIGRNGGPHPDHLDMPRGNGRAGRHAEKMAYSGQGRIVIAGRIFG